MSSHDSSHSHGHDDHKPHTGLYIKIGAALLVLTFVTVALSWVHIEAIAIVVLLGLAVASFKASLVAAIFMHLWGEKKIIWWTLALCILCFVPLVLLPVFTTSDTAGKDIAPADPHMRPDAHGGHGSEGHGAEAHGDAAHPAEAAPAAAPAEAAH